MPIDPDLLEVAGAKSITIDPDLLKISKVDSDLLEVAGIKSKGVTRTWETPEQKRQQFISKLRPPTEAGLRKEYLEREPELRAPYTLPERIGKYLAKPVTKEKLVESAIGTGIAQVPAKIPSLIKEKIIKPVTKPIGELAKKVYKKVFPEKIIPPTEIPKPPITPTIPEVPTVEVSPVQKVISALKEAKSLRKQQETIYTQERGRRMTEALKIGEKETGEKGFYAQLGAFKGKMEKVEFESIRSKLTPEDIDNLFIQIKQSPLLNEWDKLPAGKGLAKLFGEYGGIVPTEGELTLLNRVFGKEFVTATLEKRTLFQKMGEAGYQLANIPRSMMSSYDLSFGLRQAIFQAARHPKLFLNSFTKQFKWFGSEKTFIAAQEEIIRRPTYELMKKSGLSLTDLGDILSKREERFMSSWAEKIPIIGRGVRASARAYTGFANKFRADIFDDLVKNAKIIAERKLEKGKIDLIQKKLLDPTENIDLAKEIAEFVNNATGRGKLPQSLERSAVLLNSVLFSPRLMFSRLNLLNPVYYIKADPFVRKEALKSLFAFAGATGTVLGLAKLNGAEVGTNPTSADFGKIKIGNTRLDIMGGFQQYIRLAAQLTSGKITSTTTGKVIKVGEGYKPLTKLGIATRFFEYKEAPVVSFATTMARGQTVFGEPIEIPKEIANRFTPMVVSDVYEIAKDNPDLLPLSVLGVFGVGLQTYKAKTPKEKMLEKFKRMGEKLKK